MNTNYLSILHKQWNGYFCAGKIYTLREEAATPSIVVVVVVVPHTLPNPGGRKAGLRSGSTATKPFPEKRCISSISPISYNTGLCYPRSVKLIVHFRVIVKHVLNEAGSVYKPVTKLHAVTSTLLKISMFALISTCIEFNSWVTYFNTGGSEMRRLRTRNTFYSFLLRNFKFWFLTLIRINILNFHTDF